MAGPQTLQPDAQSRPGTTVTEDMLVRAIQEAKAELPDAGQEESPSWPPKDNPLGMLNQKNAPPNLMTGIASGILEAGFQTKDFLLGEPQEEDKSFFRKVHDANRGRVKESGVVNSAGYSVSQMVTGLVGMGKLMQPIKWAQKLRNGGNAARATYETAKAAMASAVVLDPHEERLSDIIESYPGLQNPVTEYLASDPKDSTAEGRFKNAIESIGLDFALIGAVKVVKLLRAGKQEEALKEIKKLEAPEAQPASLAVDDVQPPAIKPSQAPTPSEATIPQTAAENAPTAAPGVKKGGAVTYHPTEVSEENVTAILKGAAEEAAAIKKYGSKEAATEAGQILSRTTSLPWQKLTGTDEVMQFVNRSARVLETQMDAAKGGSVLTDARVAEMVRDRAALFGEDPTVVMGQLQEAGEAAKGMAANMEASFLIANRMFQETYDAAFRLRNGMLDEWGGDALRAEKDLKARLTASADLLAAARSMSSNSGRALRRLRGVHQFKPEDLAKVQSLDGAKLADLIFQTKGDPKMLAQVANPTFLRRVMDEGAFSLTNSLLWLWPTHVTNITSSMMMLVGRPTEKLLGSFVAAPKAGGDILRQRAIREYGYTAASLGDAWTAMKDAFLRGDSILSPHNTEFFQGGSTARTAQQPLPWRPIKSVSDLAYNAWVSANYRNIVGLPTRALGAADEFFKTMRYRAYVQAEAAANATQAGLKGDDFTRFVREKMEAAIDPATGQALDANALREAQVTTFQQELLKGTVGATIQNVRSQHPALTFVLPFVKTPINVLRYGWKMTPGLNLIQKEFRENIKGVHGVESQAHAYGQMMLGSTFMGLAATMVLNGKMTGGGPKEPGLLKELRAAGWQPYSYVIDRPDGSKKYIPMGRLDPVSMSMSMMADLVEALQADPEGDQTEIGIGTLALALAKNFSDKTFLQNIHQAVEAMGDETGDKGEKLLANIAGNTIPLSSAMRGVSPDPYLREARSFIDEMLKNVPGYSETLPPSRDVFGDPIQRRIGLTSNSEADLVEAEHTRMMIDAGRSLVSKIEPKFEGVDLRDITLSNGRNAYDRLQELGGQLPGKKHLKEYLAKIIRSQAYQDRPDGASDVKGTRLNALASYVEKYREAARKHLVRENPEIRALIQKRQREARGAIIANRQKRQQGEPGGIELLEALSGNR